jgi:hypothetical protein
MCHHALKASINLGLKPLLNMDQSSLDQAANTAKAEEEVEEEASARPQHQEVLLQHSQGLPHHLGRE